MGSYNVRLSDTAQDNLEQIYASAKERWSFTETEHYVAELIARCLSLEGMPNRFNRERYSPDGRSIRSFQHKAHKIFYIVDDDALIVDVIAILPSRTQYWLQL
jgi:plasmid stabilization system protein ParE